MMPAKMSRSHPFLLRGYLVCAILENALAIFALTRISSDVKNAVFLGYSASRLALFGGMALLLFALITLFAWLVFSHSGLEKSIDFLDRVFESRGKRGWFVFASLLFAAAGIVLLLIPVEKLGGTVYLVERIAPVVYLGMAVALQALLLQFLWAGGTPNWQNLKHWHSSLRIAGIVMSVFLATWAFMAWSQIGVKPEKSGWFAPGTPVLFSQVLLALAAGVGLIFLEKPIAEWLKKRVRFVGFDSIASILLWMTTALVWWSEPLRKWSYFTPAPTPPNFEYYPYSDALLYDQFAQGIMIGVGRDIGLMHRPLYVFFLAFLHSLAGQQFSKILFLQVVSLAVIPALVYLVVSHLGNRPAGVITAILVLLREKNAIALTNVIEVSHTKLLMSDMPTLALTLLLVFLLLKWLEDPSRREYLAPISGAAFGLVILIRSQAMVIVPLVLVGVFAAQWKRGRRAFYSALMFLLGVFLVVAPWVWRNYQLSGQVTVENTKIYIHLFAGGYLEPYENIEFLPGESFDDYYERMKQQITRFILNHPVEIARRYVSHFLHNQAETVAYLPVSLKFYDLRSYLKQIPFWDQPVLTLARGSLVLFLLNLGLMALGMGTAISRFKLAALIPVLIQIGYSLSVVPTGQSGWRFILPVDWIALAYYSIGLTQLIFIVAGVFFNKSSANDEANTGSNPAPARVSSAKGSGLILTAILALGVLFPLIEWIIPSRYPSTSPQDLIRFYAPQGVRLENGETLSPSDLTSFLEGQPGSTVLYGRTLYPSYYERGEFWGEENQYTIQMKGYNRLQFHLTGPQREFVFIPLDAPPAYFPHATDVFVVGCQEGSAIRALAILPKGQDAAVTISPWAGLTCPPAK